MQYEVEVIIGNRKNLGEEDTSFDNMSAAVMKDDETLITQISNTFELKTETELFMNIKAVYDNNISDNDKNQG
eukprot:CAMPEP_0205806482 /NCGR_PEP_ID=MMETSP0205-20121125/10064_1 /ASSEMBLY_ACC=CAM_ASM_000278 /TAXON_ID=36767 /ORGANISM="Euplotes focardii, Strain TN1" /LENGTH=72 /DNA_ID=CAMNT_0053079461 /DNA_START=298 /DNA_END=513 /DNA_ORIENTATION=-